MVQSGMEQQSQQEAEMADIAGDMLTHLRARRDPAVFAREILNLDLWPRQKFILRSFYGIEQDEDVLPFDFVEDEENIIMGNEYSTLVLVAGMRSSKTFMSSVIALYEAYKLITMDDPAEYYNLDTNQRIFIVNTAKNATQAEDTVYAAMLQKYENSEFFQRQNVTQHHDELIFEDNHVIIRTTHSNSSSLAGKTIKAVVVDEMAKFSETGEQSQEEVFEMLEKGTTTFGKDGKSVAISSPIAHDDYFYGTLYSKQGTDPSNDRVLGLRYKTWEINDQIDKEDLIDKRERNPEKFKRDYEARPSSGKYPFFQEQHKIDKCILNDHNEIPEEPQEQTPYVLAVDPAQKEDAFGIALAHKEDREIFVDWVNSYGGPGREIDTEAVSETIVNICKKIQPRRFVTDVGWWPETQNKVRKLGVPVEKNTVTRTEFESLKEKIYPGRIYLPDSDQLVKELKELQVKDKNTVDHRESGSKDMADAVANANYILVSDDELNENYHKPKAMNWSWN